MSTTAPAAALAIRSSSATGISCPVGLFGVFRNTSRVRGVIAAITASVGKRNSRSGGTRTLVAPTAAVALGYGSKAGSGTIVSASWMRGRAIWPTAAIRIPSSRPLVSSTQSGSTSKCLAQARTRSVYTG